MGETVLAPLSRYPLGETLEVTVMGFSQELKTRYPSLRYEEVEHQLARAQAAAVPVSRAAAISPVAKIPFKIIDILQAGLRRNLELAASFIGSFNAQLFVPLFVDARAVVETASLLWDLSMRVRRVLAQGGKGALSELDTHLMKVLLGAKSKEWVGDPDKYQAPNVLTILDRLAKSGFPQLRGFYDMLSEFAHPNFAGLQGAYAKVNATTRETTFVDRPFQVRAGSLVVPVNALSVGLNVTVTAIEAYDEDAALFVRLCEQDIHDKGTWPRSIPYPRE